MAGCCDATSCEEDALQEQSGSTARSIGTQEPGLYNRHPWRTVSEEAINKRPLDGHRGQFKCSVELQHSCVLSGQFILSLELTLVCGSIRPWGIEPEVLGAAQVSLTARRYLLIRRACVWLTNNPGTPRRAEGCSANSCQSLGIRREREMRLALLGSVSLRSTARVVQVAVRIQPTRGGC